MIAISASPEGWKQRRRVLKVLGSFGLALLAVGVTLPWLISFESPTPMPYAWPAHHALYLHTDGQAAQCTVDDGVTEPFTVTIPGSDDTYRVTGTRLSALDHGPATMRCTEPVTADLDPDIRYSIAGSAAIDGLVATGMVLTVFTAYLLAGMRAAKVG
jgi:hypothetical protein